MTLKELKAEYKQKLKDDPTQEGSNNAWKWFCKEKHKIDEEDLIIFRNLMNNPKENGMDLYYDYILDNITIVEYYYGLLSNVHEVYYDALLEEELIDPDDYLSELFEETALVIIKGTDSIGKLEEIPDRDDPEQEELRDEIDRVGSVVWYNLIEEMHQELKLPKVKKIKEYLYLTIQVEIDVVEDDNFKEFKLKNREIIYYKDLIGLNGKKVK